ncbi:MAG: HepT-like ribonuclease domain-containing protein [Thermomicrobiales bacterium]
MQKDERIYLAHMLNAALETQGYMKGKTYGDFEADSGLRRQLERMVEIIGEAARLVPQPLRDAYPHIPWSAIVGMRNRIAHDYLNIDYKILWETMALAIPTLIAELEKIVPPEMRAEP